MPRTDLGKISGKLPSMKQLVKSVQEFAKSMIEISNKVQVLKTYNETINNSFSMNRW